MLRSSLSRRLPIFVSTVACVTMVLAGTTARHATADVLSVEGTLQNVGGFDVAVLNGDMVHVDIVYDPSVPPLIPGFNGFRNAIDSITITIPEASIMLVGVGAFVNDTTLINDSAGAVDSMSMSIDGMSGTTLLGGETVTNVSVALQETLFSGAPDLLLTQESLPVPPLDFDTTGTLTMGIGMSLTGGLGNIFTATAFDPIQVPEPTGWAVWAAALASLAARGRRRSH